MPDGPLKGTRIIEIEGIGPTPFCGMHLAVFQLVVNF